MLEALAIRKSSANEAWGRRELLQPPLGYWARESRGAGVSGNPNKWNFSKFSLSSPSFLRFQPPNLGLERTPPPLLAFDCAQPSRPTLWRETERTAC